MVDQPSDRKTSAADETLDAEDGGGETSSAEETLNRIGRFVVLRPVGSGAMGVVFAAYDEQLDRKVAVKVLKRGMSRRARGRVVVEAKAMARLTHPNVVQVYEVGETETSLFIAMEYVEGSTLERWTKGRSWKEVVDAYRQAGEGLAAAHAAGVVHRDFKPSNAMVCAGASEVGRVKVLDFGLARSESSTSQHETLSQTGDDPTDLRLTAPGRVLGTPAFMAPEQWAGMDVDAAADRFSFCVSLWEGLYGQPPYAGSSIPELAASILEGRRTSPPADSEVPAWVHRVLVRGLAKRRAERWPSMEALLEALDADPAKRYRAWALGAAAVVLVGVAGLGAKTAWDARAQRCSGAAAQLAGTWDEERRAQVEARFVEVDKPYAAEAWRRTSESLDGYAERWAAMHTEACEACTVRGEQSPAMMDLRMGCLHRAAVELEAAVGVLAEADAEVVQKAHEITAGLRPLSRCADTEALAAEVEPPSQQEAEAVEAARQRLAQARSRRLAGRFEAARDAVEAGKAVAEDIEYAPVWAELALAEGIVLEELGAYEAAESALVDALERAAASKQREVMASAARMLVYVVGVRLARGEDGHRYVPLARGLSQGDPDSQAAFLVEFGKLLRTQGKYAEAEAELRAALALRQTTLGRDHMDTTSVRNSLANVLSAQGKYTEAEAEFRAIATRWEAALGADHPAVAGARNNIAASLFDQGKHPEAEAELRAALSSSEAALGPEHPSVAACRHNLGNALLRQGRYEEAEAQYRATLAVYSAKLGAEHPEVAGTRSDLGNVLRAQGRYAEAEAEYRAALVGLQQALGPEHPSVAPPRNGLGNALLGQGRYAEAEAEYRAALAVLQTALGPEHPSVAALRYSLALASLHQGRLVEAEAGFRAVLALRLDALGTEHPDVALTRVALANVLLDLDRPREALPLAARVWTRRSEDDTPSALRGQAAFLLAQVLWAVPDPDRDRVRARRLAEQAASAYEDAGDASEADLINVQTWLDAHRLR